MKRTCLFILLVLFSACILQSAAEVTPFVANTPVPDSIFINKAMDSVKDVNPETFSFVRVLGIVVLGSGVLYLGLGFNKKSKFKLSFSIPIIVVGIVLIFNESIFNFIFS